MKDEDAAWIKDWAEGPMAKFNPTTVRVTTEQHEPSTNSHSFDVEVPLLLEKPRFELILTIASREWRTDRLTNGVRSLLSVKGASILIDS